MGELVHLDGRDLMVADLERWLERAKKGQINSLAIAATMTDGEAIGTSWKLGRDGNLWTLLGAVRELDNRIIRGIDRGDTD